MFVSRKIDRDLNVKETKPPIVNQQCVVCSFQCDLCDAGYIGYTRRHLHNRVKEHKQQSSTIAKRYKNVHGKMPQDLFSARNAFHKSFKVKSQRAIRLHSCESIFIIFSPLLILRAKKSLEIL